MKKEEYTTRVQAIELSPLKIEGLILDIGACPTHNSNRRVLA